MFSSDELGVLKDFILSQIGELGFSPGSGSPSPDKPDCGGNNTDSTNAPFQLTPGQLLTIAGLLTNVLTVFSILVATDQHIEITLHGSLKRKTEMDKMMDKIGPMPFDEVLRALKDR